MDKGYTFICLKYYQGTINSTSPSRNDLKKVLIQDLFKNVIKL